MISVGIDVSKGKSTVCIVKPGGKVLETPFEMLHTMESVLLLAKLIKAYDEEVEKPGIPLIRKSLFWRKYEIPITEQ